MEAFFRAQAALCQRIARSFPQERIAAELLRIAADFEAKAAAGAGAVAGAPQDPTGNTLWSVAPQLDSTKSCIGDPSAAARVQPIGEPSEAVAPFRNAPR
ncbi:MAG TPA: hypothetical protein VFA50_06235 [Stellaceae bacterium]|nr:hypothetical protein [Stellaceae bacterium]